MSILWRYEEILVPIINKHCTCHCLKFHFGCQKLGNPTYFVLHFSLEKKRESHQAGFALSGRQCKKLYSKLHTKSQIQSRAQSPNLSLIISLERFWFKNNWSSSVFQSKWVNSPALNLPLFWQLADPTNQKGSPWWVDWYTVNLTTFSLYLTNCN